MQIKAVLFDLGGTLIKTADIPEIFKRILETYGVRVSSNQILEAHQTNEKEVNVEVGQIELRNAFWSTWNLKILERLGVKTNTEFLAKKIDELWWDYADLEFYPDVMDTLNHLKARNIKIGIVTNGLKKDYEQILQKLGAKDCFDVVVGIDACNKAKPDKEIFLLAVKKLQLKPEETIFVGDSVEKDYEGAVKAGLRPLLIDRERRASRNIKTIRSLGEVLLYI